MSFNNQPGVILPESEHLIQGIIQRSLQVDNRHKYSPGKNQRSQRENQAAALAERVAQCQQSCASQTGDSGKGAVQDSSA